MRYHLTVPARINVLGNPSDANEGDFATISAAVNVYAGALVEPAEGIVLESGPRASLGLDLDFPSGACDPEPGSEDLAPVRRQVYTPAEIPLPYDGSLDLMKGALNRLHAYSPELRRKLPGQGVRIAAWSHVPRQSGLGGSSLFVILVLAGLREFYDLDRRAHNDYVLAELTQRVEARDLGIACGFADRYVPIFGGLAYIDYHGKLYHKSLDQEPYTTYERLDPYAVELPIVAITTGIQHDSGDVHGRMRPKYIEEYDQWLQSGGPAPPMVGFMQGAWETAWRGKIAVLRGDLETFGALMNRNHELVDQMMSYCGFEDGAGWANNLCIQAALECGALGAKLTGAGGGGSVYALVRPGGEPALLGHWREIAQAAGLQRARIYQPHLCTRGLIIQNLDD
jgi:galactokinase/mevalonate kinase-like predicted kinase